MRRLQVIVVRSANRDYQLPEELSRQQTDYIRTSGDSRRHCGECAPGASNNLSQKVCHMLRLTFAALAVIPLFVVGCGQGPREEQTIAVKASNDPLELPRSVLRQYAAGQPMGSEAAGFDAMIETVRKADPARADVLQKGLEEIKAANPAARAGMANALLEKLKPSML